MDLELVTAWETTLYNRRRMAVDSRSTGEQYIHDSEALTQRLPGFPLKEDPARCYNRCFPWRYMCDMLVGGCEACVVEGVIQFGSSPWLNNH